MEKIKLIIADDQVLFLKGLRLLIHTFDTVNLVAEVRNGQELLEAIPLYSPDVILVDIKMPIMNGIEVTEKIRKQYSDIKIILLSMHNDESIMNHVMKLGANGYLLKNEEPHILKDAIEAVVAKGYYFNDYVSQALLKNVQQIETRSEKIEFQQKLKLTRRELEILKLIGQEYTSNEIAEKLFLSVRTVEGHRKRMLAKTGVRNIVGLVLFAVKNELIEL